VMWIPVRSYVSCVVVMCDVIWIWLDVSSGKIECFVTKYSLVTLEKQQIAQLS